MEGLTYLTNKAESILNNYICQKEKPKELPSWDFPGVGANHLIAVHKSVSVGAPPFRGKMSLTVCQLVARNSPLTFPWSFLSYIWRPFQKICKPLGICVKKCWFLKVLSDFSYFVYNYCFNPLTLLTTSIFLHNFFEWRLHCKNLSAFSIVFYFSKDIVPQLLCYS